MGGFGARLTPKESANFTGGTSVWTDATRRRVQEMSRVRPTIKTETIVGVLVGFSDAKAGFAEVQPIVGARFRVPYGNYRAQVHAALGTDPAQGRPFVRLKVTGDYFGEVLERAAQIEGLDVVGGPEFESRWRYLEGLGEIPTGRLRRAKQVISDAIAAGVSVRPFIYVEEGAVVLEWPHPVHGSVIVEVGDTIDVRTVETDVALSSAAARDIAGIIGVGV